MNLKKYILNGMTDLINIFQIGFERHRYVISVISYIKHADFTVLESGNKKSTHRISLISVILFIAYFSNKSML